MYKKLVLLLTFIVSFIVSINVVSADDIPELDCQYPEGNLQHAIRYNQDSKGNVTIWSNNKISGTAKDKWEIIYDASIKTAKIDNSKVSSYQDVFNGISYLKKCPPCLNYKNGSKKLIFNEYANKEKKTCSITETRIESNGNAEKLTCNYGDNNKSQIIIKQDDSGKKSIQFGSGYMHTAIPEEKLNFKNASKNSTGTGYNSSEDALTSCPPCMKLDEYTVYFDGYDQLGKCPKKYIPNIDDSKWQATCTYNGDDNTDLSVILKYNATNFELVANDNSYRAAIKTNFSAYDLNTFSLNAGSTVGGDYMCPELLYSSFDGQTEEFNLDNKGDRVYRLTDENYEKEPNRTEYPKIDNCQDLFGDEIMEIINKVMNVIRIIVPILLLIFGSTDFFTAVFSDSEDNMKEHRNRFFKRIVAALIVFIVPIFVNLVLKLANSVWSDIHSETCVNNE